MSKNLSLTVAIPTCYGGASLVEAIESIRRSDYPEDFKVVVRADSIPIPENIKKKLDILEVELTENSEPGSQLHKVKQMIDECNDDIFIFTQDDIRFDSKAISKIIKAFETDPNLTMIGANIQPEKATTRFERVVEVGLRIAYQVGTTWNKGDNYLLSNGRCIAFRTSFLKTFNLPEKMVNTDAYLYFENKRLSGKFIMLKDAIVYNVSPKNFKEHLRQRNRFLFSKEEMQQFFNHNIDAEYKLPTSLLFKASIKELVTHPINFVGYVLIQIGAQINQYIDSSYKNPLWKVNTSTKRG